MKKPLPTVSAPTLVCTLPVSGIKIKYRPFVVREQKALLLAQESKDPDTIIETIKSVLLSCTNNTLEFAKIPTADIGYFFLQLRIASAGPEVKFGIACENCETEIIAAMSLSDVTVDASKVIKDVKITDTVGITFRLPTIEDVFETELSDAKSTKMLYSLIECIYDEDSVYQKSDYTEDEFRDWIEGLNDAQLSEIKRFVDSIPELSHTLTFACSSCGHTQSRTLEGLHNFFRFGPDS